MFLEAGYAGKIFPLETCHQPITAKNDPSDQESDIHSRLLPFGNVGCITRYQRASTVSFAGNSGIAAIEIARLPKAGFLRVLLSWLEMRNWR
jgi:hypothetical protein